jgi:hypothetical protein
MVTKKISIDGTITELPDKKYETLRQAVEGYIERVYLGKGKALIVNEEGLLEKLPLNVKASKLVGFQVVGNVVIIDGDIED